MANKCAGKNNRAQKKNKLRTFRNLFCRATYVGEDSFVGSREGGLSLFDITDGSNYRTRQLALGIAKALELNRHTVDVYENTWKCGELNPFSAPDPLRILKPSNFVPKTGFQW